MKDTALVLIERKDFPNEFILCEAQMYRLKESDIVEIGYGTAVCEGIVKNIANVYSYNEDFFKLAVEMAKLLHIPSPLPVVRAVYERKELMYDETPAEAEEERKEG